jgi:hypothetical protein
MARKRRYPSDLTDEQWEIIEAMLPLPKWMGRPFKHVFQLRGARALAKPPALATREAGVAGRPFIAMHSVAWQR